MCLYRNIYFIVFDFSLERNVNLSRSRTRCTLGRPRLIVVDELRSSRSSGRTRKPFLSVESVQAAAHITSKAPPSSRSLDICDRSDTLHGQLQSGTLAFGRRLRRLRRPHASCVGGLPAATPLSCVTRIAVYASLYVCARIAMYASVCVRACMRACVRT